jgi:ribosomal protein L37AE/L43A
MALFVEREATEYICPSCGGAMEKVTRPVNHQVFQCVDCEDEFGEGYLNGYQDAMKKALAEFDRNPTKDALDLALPSGHSGSSLECMHPFCVAERNPPSQ